MWVPYLLEIESDILFLSVSAHHGDIDGGLVDLGVHGQLAVGLQTTRLVRRVLVDNVCLFLLEFSQADQYNITL
jgi:hypothetical protein